MSGANLSCLLKKTPHLSFFLGKVIIIITYCGWLRNPAPWMVETCWNPINRGINYLSGGLLPPIVSPSPGSLTAYSPVAAARWPPMALPLAAHGRRPCCWWSLWDPNRPQHWPQHLLDVRCLDDFWMMFDDFWGCSMIFFVIFDWGCWWLFDDFRWFVDDYLMFIEMQTRSFRGWTFGAKKSGHIHIRWIDMNIQKLNWEIIKSNLCLRFSYGNAQVFWVNSVNAHGTMTGGWTSRTTTGYHGSRRPPGEFERLNPGCGWLVGGDWNHGILWLSKNSWEWSHHPNWRSPSFFKGVGQPPTTWSFFVVETTGFARLI